jgi:hypothetical protein
LVRRQLLPGLLQKLRCATLLLLLPLLGRMQRQQQMTLVLMSQRT